MFDRGLRLFFGSATKSRGSRDKDMPKQNREDRQAAAHDAGSNLCFTVHETVQLIQLFDGVIVGDLLRPKQYR